MGLTLPPSPGADDGAWKRRLTLALMVGLVVVIASLSICSCAHTMEAAQNLPDGYWVATRDLVLGIIFDVLDLIGMIA